MENPVKEENKSPKKKVKSPFLRLIFSKALKQSEEERNLQVDMLQYRSNSVATTTGYIGLIGLIVGFCFLYSTITVNMNHHIALFGYDNAGIWCGVDIFINIGMMLFTFLTISRMKVYDKNWGIVGICLGVFQVVRLFFYPLALFNANTESTTVLPGWLFTMQVICYIVFGVCMIAAGIVTIILAKILNDYRAELGKKEAR